MHDETDFNDFCDHVQQGHKVIPVTKSLFADAETPISIYRKLASGVPGTFLLESAEQGGIWSRFSFVGVSSYGVLTDNNGVPLWQDYGLSAADAFGDDLPQTSLAALDALYRRWKTPRIPGLPPLTGALVGFIGWEAIRELEDLPHQPPADFSIPGQALSFSREVVVLDHKFGTVTLVSNVLVRGEHFDNSTAFEEAQHRLSSLQDRLAQPGNPDLATINLDTPVSSRYRTERQDFLDSVASAKSHIIDGDVFQVVISQRFDVDNSASAEDVYRVLRSLNPSPYMYLLSLETPDKTPYFIVGSSPEALVKVSSGRVFTHPIAGSRPRGTSPEEDLELETDLLADDKERSEHLMLVDLARNDLLRVCEAGSVEVTEFMRIERFSHIMHIVSSVEGNLLPGNSPVDVFRATFPAGTLSGAPKPRALEIIDSLEPAQRGVYGGVVGYFDFSGDADLAIAIRTVTLLGGTAYVQAGAGLVMDSVAEMEYLETENKAAAPLRAVAIANALKKI